MGSNPPTQSLGLGQGQGLIGGQAPRIPEWLVARIIPEYLIARTVELMRWRGWMTSIAIYGGVPMTSIAMEGYQ